MIKSKGRKKTKTSSVEETANNVVTYLRLTNLAAESVYELYNYANENAKIFRKKKGRLKK